MNEAQIKKYIATFLIILMSIQILAIEGYDVSIVKFGVMYLCPIVWLMCSPKITMAIFWITIYFLAQLLIGQYHVTSFRFSTVGYSLAFMSMFITYYTLVYYEQVFTYDYFIKLIKRLILAYTLVLIIQQVMHLVGIRSLLFNSINIYSRGWLAGNSLSCEPSHSARILAVLFLGLLRMYEIKKKKENVTLKTVYAEAKWTILGFLWCMLTMGSGTAFIALIILGFYFIKRKFIIIVVPIIMLLYFIAPSIKYEPLQRALSAIETTMTFDTDAIIEADGSAAYRIVPIVNTLTKLDITKKESWIGHGIDTVETSGLISNMSMIGGITDYGLIVFILSVIFIYTYCIKGFFSLESIMYILLLRMSIRNIYWVWAIFMIWMTVKYFQEQHENKLTEI